jgi:uroporphyrinogen decarboxylase
VQRLTGQDSSTLGTGTRQWADEHTGPIGGMADLQRFPWPEQNDVDFGPLEAAAQVLPDGMALIGFSGGVLEFSMDLLGMESFMLATHRDPELVAAVTERVGQTIYEVFRAYCQMESVCAIWLGDDLGHKHGLLVSPKLLEAHVFPWYRRFADLAHQHDRPFLLHTCGNTEAVMPTLVEDVGIDAKHSFEDSIQPVEQFYDRWGGKIAVLGGIDVHLLSVGDQSAIRARTLQILEHAAPRGGYACGSGNSIPDYVSPENYLTMIEALAEFNGRG